MKQRTDILKQWLWFAVLWCCGLTAVALLAGVTRWLVRFLKAAQA